MVSRAGQGKDFVGGRGIGRGDCGGNYQARNATGRENSCEELQKGGRGGGRHSTSSISRDSAEGCDSWNSGGKLQEALKG